MPKGCPLKKSWESVAVIRCAGPETSMCPDEAGKSLHRESFKISPVSVFRIPLSFIIVTGVGPANGMPDVTGTSRKYDFFSFINVCGFSEAIT
jgi:hypothetical protein